MTASIRQGAFTLVELLVVVTIIVLLLALLTPALSRAVYEAQLVQCGAQMRLAASGQVLYAMDHKRYWMYRRVIENRHTFSHLLKGAKVFIAVDADIDDRPVHEGYVDLDWLFDTLATKVDPKLHPGEVENPQETIYSNYSLQYGWGYTLGDSGIEYPPMKKMGDRWEARDDKRGGRVTAFRWLLSDSDMYGRDPASGEGGGADASHPIGARPCCGTTSPRPGAGTMAPAKAPTSDWAPACRSLSHSGRTAEHGGTAGWI